MTNPIAAAFIVEAMLLVGVFAYLLFKWRVTRLPWWWFVLFSLFGEHGVHVADSPALASTQTRVNRRPPNIRLQTDRIGALKMLPRARLKLGVRRQRRL